MIVAFQPGGNIKDARVVLKPDELVPAKFNTESAIVYRESPDGGPWLLVKPRFTVLPGDSPLLSQLELPEVETFPLTNPEEPVTLFEHRDIIRMDEEEE
jgi:hypothetical protein